MLVECWQIFVWIDVSFCTAVPGCWPEHAVGGYEDVGQHGPAVSVIFGILYCQHSSAAVLRPSKQVGQALSLLGPQMGCGLEMDACNPALCFAPQRWEIGTTHACGLSMHSKDLSAQRVACVCCVSAWIASWQSG